MRLDQFNRGDYMGAVADQVSSESIVRMLYPNDDTPAGQELRLTQEYFFTSASLQDLLRRHLQQERRSRARCPTRSRSSSTTPIRRSRSPS